MSVEALFVTATCLILLELFIPSLGLLTFGGFVAFSTGIIILFMNDMDNFYGLDIEIVAAIGLLIFLTYAIFGYYLLKIYRRKSTTGVESMIGQSVTITIWNETDGKVTFEGEDWKAISNDAFQPNDTAIITACEKNTLTLKKEN